MPKRIVICCDGTGNEIEGNLSNVLKLYRIANRDENQRVYYDPGIGTLGQRDDWSRFKQNAKGVFGLATGYGLDDNVLDAYRFLARNFKDHDDIYLFGFSRGAYTVRVLAGFLHLIGLLQPDQLNIDGYAFAAYKRASEQGDFTIAWNFRRIANAQSVAIRFLGVWDTVASVLVPRRDRLYVPSLLTLPYTRTNPSVQTFRQAMAIDERRRMFRLNRWTEPQEYTPNPFAKPDPLPQQEIKQVWFAGVHADIGGGYPETESGLSKYPLGWMIEEARAAGLHINVAMQNHLVLGHERKGSHQNYVPPDAKGPLHNSMTGGWRILEWLPKSTRWRETPQGTSFTGWYLPRSEPRLIPEGAHIHHSVFARQQADPTYRPPNLPKQYEVEGTSDMSSPQPDLV
jgi:uncharacterized protein (DUF2235 family)